MPDAQVVVRRLPGTGPPPPMLDPEPKEQEQGGGGGRGSSENEKRRSVDCSTLTELHSSTEVPEVEVISLLGEDLPRYRLRADYLTSFGGYGHGDFSTSTLDTPVLSKEAEQEVKGLTTDQVRTRSEAAILVVLHVCLDL